MTADDISWRRRGRTAPETVPPRSRPKPPPRSGGGGAGPRQLTPAERVRVARRSPQAVIKVMTFRAGRDAVRRSLGYAIGKAAWRFHVEGDVAQEGQGAVKAMLEEWEADFTVRRNGRDVVHIELSCPPGSDRDRVFAAARSFADTTFSPNHRYALAEHRDTRHPHCHLLVKLAGHDGSTLNPRKGDLARWRAAFAAAGRAQGLDLEASPRAARGVGTKGIVQAVYQLRRRGQLPYTDVARAQAAQADLDAGRTAPSDYERAQGARNAAERRAFAREAERVGRAADAAPNAEERRMLAAMAHDLAAFAAALPTPQTERQALLERLARERADPERGLERGD